MTAPAPRTVAELAAVQEARRSLFGRPVAAWTDDEIADVLTDRYQPSVIPPCRVCGEPLSCQAMGGGEPTTWACSGYEATETGGSRMRRDRKIADEHYRRSEYRDVRQGGDPVAIEALSRWHRAAEMLRALPVDADVVAERDRLRGMVAALVSAFDGYTGKIEGFGAGALVGAFRAASAGWPSEARPDPLAALRAAVASYSAALKTERGPDRTHEWPIIVAALGLGGGA